MCVSQQNAWITVELWVLAACAVRSTRSKGSQQTLRLSHPVRVARKQRKAGRLSRKGGRGQGRAGPGQAGQGQAGAGQEQGRAGLAVCTVPTPRLEGSVCRSLHGPMRRIPEDRSLNRLIHKTPQKCSLPTPPNQASRTWLRGSFQGAGPVIGRFRQWTLSELVVLHALARQRVLLHQCCVEVAQGLCRQ